MFFNIKKLLYLSIINVKGLYRMNIGIDTTSTVAHSAITAGTTAVVLAPDHTTQILSVVVQVIALIMLLFKRKKGVE